MYVDNYLLIRVQHSDDDRSALIASASLASDRVHLFGPGEDGVTPILAPKKSTDWGITIDALGFTINSHTLRILFSREKQNDLRDECAITGPRADSKSKRRKFATRRASCETSRT